MPLTNPPADGAKVESGRGGERFSRCLGPTHPVAGAEDSKNKAPYREIYRLTENHERKTWTAAFAFQLAGVIWNGYTLRMAEAGLGEAANGDPLLSRLLPRFGANTAVDFIFTGGAGLKFGFSIHGSVEESSSPDEALSAAERLRQGLQVVLAGEPGLMFLSEGVPAKQRLRLSALNPHSARKPSTMQCRAHVVPRCISFPAPGIQSVGFGSTKQGTAVVDAMIHLSLPFAGTRSFRSLAETVVLSPSPVSFYLRFKPSGLDEGMRSTVACALRGLQQQSYFIQDILRAKGYDPALTEHFRQQLQGWLRTPTGASLDCEILSPQRLPNALLEMAGSDIFGVPIEIASNAPDGARREFARHAQTPAGSRQGLDLASCLSTDEPWPRLFPNGASLANGPVRRLFNHRIPPLGPEGVVLGRIPEKPDVKVRLKEQDRAQHVYVLGATGTGKSTLLFNMIVQDIRARRGVGLIDPHGDLYDQVLDAIPPARSNDVILFDPGDPDRAPGFNPLECGDRHREQQVNFIINEFLKTFERLYDMRVCGGPMFEAYFRNAMLLLMESELEDVTLTELPLVFEDPGFRRFLKSRCKHPLTVSFWNHQAEKARGESALENMAPYIVSKLNVFTYNSLVRAIVGQAKSTIDLHQALERQGVLLVKLPKGILGELDSQLLGSFLLSKIFSAALSRARTSPARRRPFHLYVDEFQNFTNDSLAHMLSEARKYGLHLALANQTLAQLQESQGRHNLVDEVLGNAGNLILFRSGPAEAAKLWSYTEPEFDRLDLQSLPNYCAIGRLLGEAGPTRPFVFQTLPARPVGRRERVDSSVWEMRRRSLSRPIPEVEAEIVRRRAAYKESVGPQVHGKASAADILGTRSTF